MFLIICTPGFWCEFGRTFAVGGFGYITTTRNLLRRIIYGDLVVVAVGSGAGLDVVLGLGLFYLSPVP
jgi:hypothetical protein